MKKENLSIDEKLNEIVKEIFKDPVIRFEIARRCGQLAEMTYVGLVDESLMLNVLSGCMRSIFKDFMFFDIDSVSVLTMLGKTLESIDFAILAREHLSEMMKSIALLDCDDDIRDKLGLKGGMVS